MAAQATQAELNRFVKVVDEFKANLSRLKSPEYKTRVLQSGDSRLISDYNTAVVRGDALNRSIAALVGAWAAFKRGYAAVTDTTSMYIGDAIDEIRSWFGYKPMGNVPGIFGEDVISAQQPYDKDANYYGQSYSLFPGAQPGYSQMAGLGAAQLAPAAVAAVAVAGVISAAMLLNSLMTKIFIRIEATKIQESNPNISRGAALAQAETGIAGPGLFGGSVTPVMIAAGALALWFVLGKK